LKKFNKKIHELKNIIDKWVFFIKNAEELEVMPENIDDEGLKEAYEEAAQHNWTKEAYDAYIYSGIRDQDDRGRIELAEQRAKFEQLVELVLNLYNNGVTIDIIARSANKSEEEIKQVIENQKDK
jgi:predicted transposase/invertase (TIGR01784 family)